MPRFFRRLAEGVFDQEDLERGQKNWPNSWSAPRGLRHFGRQAGGCWIFKRREHRIESVLALSRNAGGGMLIRGMVPFVPKQPVELNRTPVLLLSGVDDPIVARMKWPSWRTFCGRPMPR